MMKDSIQRRITVGVLAAALLMTLALTGGLVGSAAAQSAPTVEESTVDSGGSQITIRTGGSAVLEVGDLPAGSSVGDVSDGGSYDSDDGSISWFTFSDGLPETITFTLIPPEEGDTVQFTLDDGSNENTVTLDVNDELIEAGLPEGETLTPSIVSGDTITQEVVVTNNGDQAATETVSLSIQDVNGFTVAEDSVTVENLAAGASQTETLSLQADATPGEYTFVLAAGGTQQLSQSLTIIDPPNTAAITGDVRDIDRELPPNVEAIDIRISQDGNEIEESPVNPNSNGEYTIEVPVADGGSTYSVVVDNPRFNSFSRQVEVLPQSTKRIDIRLQNSLEANKIGVALWDSEQKQVIGDAAALLADGEFDGPVELVVYAQAQGLDTQPAPAAPSSTTADVTVENLDQASNIFDAGQGAFLDPANDEASESDVTVLLDDGTVSADAVDTDVPDSATVGNAEFDVGGNVAYGTFSVTAGDVTKEEVEEFANAVAQGEIEASIDETGISDTSDLTYFVEGEKSTQHQVLDTDGEPIEDANVWVSYAGAPQNYDDVQEFQNEAGESFLTATTDATGTAVIPGLVPGVNYHVYVQADGFDIYNSSQAAAQGASDLSAATGIDQNTFVADYTLFEEITSVAGSSQSYTHVLQRVPRDIALDVTVADDTGTQVKSTDMPGGTVREVQVEATSGVIGQPVSTFDPLAGQTVTLELTTEFAGELVNADDNGELQVETNENGIATAEFEAVVANTIATNVTASTQNAQGDIYETDSNPAVGQGVNDDSSQAEINVFTTGSLTGDVLDRNQDPIEGATVTLQRQTDDGDYVDTGDTDTTTASGLYVFQDLRAQQNYRVTAEFEGDSGFSAIDDLRVGTNTRDVVLQGSNQEDPTGELTGDVLDRNQDPIEGATVTLQRQTDDGDYVDTGDTDTTTTSGQYVFQDLRAQQNYRVIAEFEGDSGFATVDALRAGTNSRDVVIESVNQDEPPSSTEAAIVLLSSDGDPVSPGDSFDVTFEVTNIGSDDASTGGIQFSTPPSISTEDVVFGDGISAGESISRTVTFDVADDVASDDYTLTAEGTVGPSSATTSVDFTVSSETGSSGPVAQDEVSLGGSTITVSTGGANSLSVSELPSDVDVTAQDGGTYNPQGGEILWTDFGDGLPETVSFTLTPSDNYADGDTISFTAGGESVTLDVVETSVPSSPVADVEDNQYGAVAGDDGEMNAPDLSDAINQWSQTGSVNGVSVGAPELSRLINYWANN